MLLLAHIVSAFHFVHEWQHTSAVTETAQQTAKLIGWKFGGGVYFNYTFAALWVADTSWQWIALDGYAKRSRIASVAIHAYLFFIVVNGAIIFEGGPTRWIGLVVVALIVLQVIRRFVSPLQ